MTMLDQGMNSLLHSLLPARLRATLKPNTAAYIRARSLTIMLVVVTMMSISYQLILIGIHLVTDPELLVRDLLFLCVASLLVLQTWLYYRFHNVWISGLAFTNFYFFTIIVILVLNGGYDSPGKAVLLTCPMVSFVAGSRHEGIQSAIVSVLVWWILVFLYSIHFHLPDILSTQDEHVVFAMNWVFSVTVVALALTVFEHELQNGDGRRRERIMRFEREEDEIRKRVEQYLHNLLPVQLRTSLDRYSMDYTRALILAILLPVATLLSFIAAGLVIAVDLAIHSPQLQYDINILVVGPCFAVQMYLYYRFGNTSASGKLLGAFVFTAIVGIVVLTGGYDSPVMPLMLLCPVGFFMTNGIRDGLICAVLIAGIGVLFAFLHHANHVFTDFFHDEAKPITAGIIWTISIIALMVCMVAYDNRLEKL